MEPQTISAIDEEIKKISARHQQLLEKRAGLAALKPIHRLAFSMYRALRRSNVDDDWYYNCKNDIPQWTGHDQPRYLNKAVHLVEAITRHLDRPVTTKDTDALIGQLELYFDNWYK